MTGSREVPEILNFSSQPSLGGKPGEENPERKTRRGKPEEEMKNPRGKPVVKSTQKRKSSRVFHRVLTRVSNSKREGKENKKIENMKARRGEDTSLSVS